MQRLGVPRSHYACSKAIEACAVELNRCRAVLELLSNMAVDRLTPDMVDFLHLVQVTLAPAH